MTTMEHQNEYAQNHGFKDYNEYHKHWRHVNGENKPMSENKDCSSFLGVHVAERVLSNVFRNVQRMPCNNPGYDFICGKGFKIDVKSSVLHKNRKGLNFSHYWEFKIYKNAIADYFLLLAFDNREDLNPLHIWLIKANQPIKAHWGIRKTSDVTGIAIFNTEKHLHFYEPFELYDKLNEVISCCNTLRTPIVEMIQPVPLIHNQGFAQRAFVNLMEA